MPRKSASKAAASPKTPATSEGTPSRRGNRTPAKKPAEVVETHSSEPKRSRRSSTAVQTAASQADSRRTRSHSNRNSSQSPVSKSSSRDEGADANTSNTSRSTRRPMKKVNYEESEGEEDTTDKSAQPEEDYNAEEDLENDSDSLEASSKKEEKEIASPPPKDNSRKQSGSSASPRAARSSRKKKKDVDGDEAGEGEDAEVETETKDKAEADDVTDAPTAPNRRRRYSSEKDEKPKEGTRSRRSAAVTTTKSTPPPTRPARAVRQPKSVSTEKEEVKPVRSSNRSRRSKVEEPKEDEAEKMEENDSEQKSEAEGTERKRKLNTGEDVPDGQKSKKTKLDENEVDTPAIPSTEEDKVKKDEVKKDESNADEPMEEKCTEVKRDESKPQVDEKQEEDAELDEEQEEHVEKEEVENVEGEAEKEDKPADKENEEESVVEKEEELKKEEDDENEGDEDDSAGAGENVAEVATEKAESATDKKSEADVEKSTADEPAEEEEEPVEEEEEALEDEEPVEDEEEPMEEETLADEPMEEEKVPESSEHLSLSSSQDAKDSGLSSRKDGSPMKSAAPVEQPKVSEDDLTVAGRTPVVADSAEAANQESLQSCSVKKQESVNGAPAVDQMPKDIQSKSEPTQMLPSSAVELNQQQQHLVPSKPEPEVVRISANGHVADDKALNADVTAEDFSSWLLHGRPYFTNRSPCAEALSRLSERTFGIVSLNLESTKVDDQFLLELKSVSSDIVCMQGISSELFHQKLEPSLTGLGYKGTFAQDEGQVVATFYKASVFQLKTQKSLPLKQTIGKDLEHGLPPGERSAVAEKLPLCGQVLFTYLSLTQSTRSVAVANVLVPPSDVSTQALQMSCLARESVAFLESRGTGGGVPLVLCGAFNMLQQEAAYQLLRDGYLSNEMIEILQSKKELKLPGREEDTSLVNLLWKSFQHSASGLKSCYSAVTGKEFEFGSQGSTRTSPDLIWFSSDSLTPIGVLQAPPSPTGHHLLLKADLAFNY